MAKRVLVVEDNRKWRQALCRFYESVLRQASHAVEVTPASNGEDALRLLRMAESTKRPFDLLSLDINLGRLGDTGHFDDGRDVLSKAHSLKAARSVIIVTGVGRDEEIDLLVTDSRERISIRANLPSLLARLFPNDRSHYLPKINLDDPDEEIESHLEGDFRDRVLKLSHSQNRFCYERLGHRMGWRISYGDAEVFIQNDKPGGLRAIALLLQRPNPEVDFSYNDLFVPEVGNPDVPMPDQAYLRMASLSATAINISDAKKDTQCIKRLEELDTKAKKLLEALADAQNNLIPDDVEIERIRDEMEDLRLEMEFIMKDGYKYDKERKTYVPFRNTFSRPDKKVTDLYKKRIKRALAKIVSLHEKCGQHLSEYISVRGNRIAYLPREPVDWDVIVN